MTPSTTAPRRRIVAIFFLHALSQGGLFSRIPDIQQALGLDPGQLGLALLGQPAGAILMFLFASVLVEAVGTRAVLVVAIPLLSLSVAVMGFSPNSMLLFLAFMIYGAAFGASNISMNVEADRVEAMTGQRVMNTCHGVWSAGLLMATLLGTLARGLGVPPGVHFLALLPVVLIASAIVIWPLRPAPPRLHNGGAKRGRIALPTPMILLLLGFALAGALLEGGLRNWSVIYMRDSFSAPAWVDTLTLPAFLIAQSTGRLFSDRIIARLGAVPVARGGMVLALVGLVSVVLAPHLVVALLGFLLIGLGICVAFPLTTSAAARLGDRPSSENVASLTLATQVTLLGAPWAMGSVANVFGIRATYAMLVPFVLLAIVLARYLAPRARA